MYALIDMVRPGGLKGYGERWADISNQIEDYERRLRHIIFPSSNLCNINDKARSSRAVFINETEYAVLGKTPVGMGYTIKRRTRP